MTRPMVSNDKAVRIWESTVHSIYSVKWYLIWEWEKIQERYIFNAVANKVQKGCVTVLLNLGQNGTVLILNSLVQVQWILILYLILLIARCSSLAVFGTFAPCSVLGVIKLFLFRLAWNPSSRLFLILAYLDLGSEVMSRFRSPLWIRDLLSRIKIIAPNWLSVITQFLPAPPRRMSAAATAAQDAFINWGLQWSSIGCHYLYLNPCYSDQDYSAFIYYDYALTFPSEVKYMWRVGSYKKTSTLLYILCRYALLSNVLYSISISDFVSKVRAWAMLLLFLSLIWFRLVCRGFRVYIFSDWSRWI